MFQLRRAVPKASLIPQLRKCPSLEPMWTMKLIGTGRKVHEHKTTWLKKTTKAAILGVTAGMLLPWEQPGMSKVESKKRGGRSLTDGNHTS
jgi:hypothetical protein